MELDTCPFGIGDNNQVSASPPLWVEREKNKWPVYEEYLHYKKAVARNPDMEFLCSDHLWLVSDGGLAGDLGYYGWVIANDSKVIWEGRGRTPGHSHQLDSLRTESSGMLHALTVLAYMLPKKPQTKYILIQSQTKSTY